MADAFWAAIDAQIEQLETASNAEEVLRILAPENNPYGDTSMVAGDGFFAGSGGDASVSGALRKAGWTCIWAKANYFYVMRAPDGSLITYIEGDIYRGDKRSS